MLEQLQPCNMVKLWPIKCKMSPYFGKLSYCQTVAQLSAVNCLSQKLSSTSTSSWLREAFNQNSLMQLFNGDRRIVQWLDSNSTKNRELYLVRSVYTGRAYLMTLHLKKSLIDLNTNTKKELNYYLVLPKDSKEWMLTNHDKSWYFPVWRSLKCNHSGWLVTEWKVKGWSQTSRAQKVMPLPLSSMQIATSAKHRQ